MFTAFLLAAACLAGFSAVRLLPSVAALSALVVAVPAAALLSGALAAVVIAAGAALAVAMRSRVRSEEGEGDQLLLAQREAEAAVDLLAGVPGTAAHEDMAIAALLSAIEAVDPDEQLAGFREATQLARQGRLAATPSHS